MDSRFVAAPGRISGGIPETIKNVVHGSVRQWLFRTSPREEPIWPISKRAEEIRIILPA